MVAVFSRLHVLTVKLPATSPAALYDRRRRQSRRPQGCIGRLRGVLT
jgi:hypothetical protein